MKKLIHSLVAITTISLSSFGQAPEGFKYQAVVRDAGNTILNNQAVGVLMTIRQGSIGGTAVYQESFSTSTNTYGLMNLEIGSGNPIVGDFSVIDWSNGPFFMQTSVDITGGTNYVAIGTSELLSVPYALHSNTANTANTANSVSNSIIELVSGSTNNAIDVTGVSVIYANLIPGTNDVIINGLSNGVIGQVVYISNTANPFNNGTNIILNSNSANGDQKFDSPLNGGVNFISSGSGIPCFFDGVKWIVMRSSM